MGRGPEAKALGHSSFCHNKSLDIPLLPVSFNIINIIILSPGNMSSVSEPQPIAQPVGINQQGYTPESMEMAQPRADQLTGMFWRYPKCKSVIRGNNSLSRCPTASRKPGTWSQSKRRWRLRRLVSWAVLLYYSLPHTYQVLLHSSMIRCLFLFFFISFFWWCRDRIYCWQFHDFSSISWAVFSSLPSLVLH